MLSGADLGETEVEAVESVLAAELQSAGYTVARCQLRDHRIGYCVGCFECWTKTPGECRLHDDGWNLGAAVLDCDLLVFSSAVRFGGYASELKKAIDRLLALLLPFFVQREGETHHPGRYARYPALLGLGVQSRHDEDEARVFRELVRRNAVNLCAPRAASCVVPPGEDGRRALREALASMREEVSA